MPRRSGRRDTRHLAAVPFPSRRGECERCCQHPDQLQNHSANADGRSFSDRRTPAGTSALPTSTSCWRRRPISTRWRPIWSASSSRRAGFTLETNSESPAGAGISGSSALMIATTAALARFVGRKIDIEQIRVIAQNVEAQLIRVPTGCQDYYPAMYGGVSAVHLEPDGIRWEPMPVSLDEIDQRFVLFYTGAPRQSGINNWEVFKQHIDGDKHVIRNFAEISRIAQAMRRALAEAQWDDVERLMREEWKLRRTNAPGITTPLIDKLIAVAMQHGARAAKVCGAGGGGCVIVFIEKGSRQRVEDAIRENGGQPLDFSVARQGLAFHSAPELETAKA